LELVAAQTGQKGRLSMTHATETPKGRLAPEPDEIGFRYVINWMRKDVIDSNLNRAICLIQGDC